jgi:chemotaxis protein CheD
MMPVTTLAAPAEWHVNVGQSAARRAQGVLSCVGLGSCVAVFLYDEATRIGAVAHILLPHEALSRTVGGPARYASTAVRHLLDEMRALGPIEAPAARLVGGASMFASLMKGGAVNMGERNVVATRRALAAAEVPLVGEDVGGDYGRSAWFDVATGVVRVTSIRHGERFL